MTELKTSYDTVATIWINKKGDMLEMDFDVSTKNRSLYYNGSYILYKAHTTPLTGPGLLIINDFIINTF